MLLIRPIPLQSWFQEEQRGKFHLNLTDFASPGKATQEVKITTGPRALGGSERPHCPLYLFQHFSLIVGKPEPSGGALDNEML